MLNGASVWLVDTADLAFGATAYSSRLIHGGLRYLEFAEFSLVKESLDERGRLLQLGPASGEAAAAVHSGAEQLGRADAGRGQVFGPAAANRRSRPIAACASCRSACGFTTAIRKGGSLPPRSLHQPGEAGVPAVSRNVARRLWAYSDAQITYPERLVIDFLADARQAGDGAAAIDFRVLDVQPGDAARRRPWRFDPVGDAAAAPIATIEPAAIINATGAWVDATLARLPAAVAAADGRHEGEPFRHVSAATGGVARRARASIPRPATAGRCSCCRSARARSSARRTFRSRAIRRRPWPREQELEYLLSVVADVFPDCGLDARRHHDAPVRRAAAAVCRCENAGGDHAAAPARVERRVDRAAGFARRRQADDVPLAGGGNGGGGAWSGWDEPVLATSRERPIPPTRSRCGLGGARNATEGVPYSAGSRSHRTTNGPRGWRTSSNGG